MSRNLLLICTVLLLCLLTLGVGVYCFIWLQTWKGARARAHTHKHTHTHIHTHINTHTINKFSLDEGSARRKDVLDSTQQSKQMNILSPGGFGSRTRSNIAASEARLRPRGHRHLHFWFGGGNYSF